MLLIDDRFSRDSFIRDIVSGASLGIDRFISDLSDGATLLEVVRSGALGISRAPRLGRTPRE